MDSRLCVEVGGPSTESDFGDVQTVRPGEAILAIDLMPSAR